MSRAPPSNGLETRHVRPTLWQAVWAPFGRVLGWWRNPWVTGAVSLMVFAVALQLIARELEAHSGADLRAAFDNLGWLGVTGALAMVAASYAGLHGNDRYGLAMLGRSVSVRRTVRASLTAYALAKGLGYSWATAGTARQRLYRRWGIAPEEIGTLSTITGVAVMLAGVTVAGAGLALGGAVELDGAGRLPFEVWMLVALICLMPAAFWASFLLVGPRTLDIGGTRLAMPDVRTGLSHLGVVMLDKIGAATALYLLLPDHGGWDYPAFLAIFVLAGLVGSLSGAPGGLGVFEAVILALAPLGQDAPGAAVALLMYRLLYTVLPLVLALAILTWEHARPATGAARKVVSQIGGQVPGQGHRLLAIAVFAAGLAVLMSVVAPVTRVRFALLERIDLGLVSDLAHAIACGVAVGLMGLAGALWRDIAGSWKPVLLLLLTGVIACLLKGLDWEEALVLAGVAVAVFVLRDLLDSPRHDARGRLRAAITARWWFLLAGAVVSAATLAMSAHPDLGTLQGWLSALTGSGEQARVARGLAGAAAVVLGLGVLAWQATSRGPELPVIAPGEWLSRLARQGGRTLWRADALIAAIPGWQAVELPAGQGDAPAFVLFSHVQGRMVVWGRPFPMPDSDARWASTLGTLLDLAADRGLEPVFVGCEPSAAETFAALGLAVHPLYDWVEFDAATGTATGTEPAPVALAGGLEGLARLDVSETRTAGCPPGAATLLSLVRPPTGPVSTWAMVLRATSDGGPAALQALINPGQEGSGVRMAAVVASAGASAPLLAWLAGEQISPLDPLADSLSAGGQVHVRTPLLLAASGESSVLAVLDLMALQRPGRGEA